MKQIQILLSLLVYKQDFPVLFLVYGNSNDLEHFCVTVWKWGSFSKPHAEETKAEVSQGVLWEEAPPGLWTNWWLCCTEKWGGRSRSGVLLKEGGFKLIVSSAVKVMLLKTAWFKNSWVLSASLKMRPNGVKFPCKVPLWWTPGSWGWNWFLTWTFYPVLHIFESWISQG